jgi:hypothetical protein
MPGNRTSLFQPPQATSGLQNSPVSVLQTTIRYLRKLLTLGTVKVAQLAVSAFLGLVRGTGCHPHRSELNHETGLFALMPPFAASFFCNCRHLNQIWRKRVGVESNVCQNLKELQGIGTPPKQRKGMHGHAYCPRIAHAFCSCTFPLWQHHLNHSAIRVSQCLGNRLRVDVQGCANISMPQ